MKFFTYTNERLRSPRKFPTKNKEDYSIPVNMHKGLFKARYLNLILHIISTSTLRGPDIGGRDILAGIHFSFASHGKSEIISGEFSPNFHRR